MSKALDNNKNKKIAGLKIPQIKQIARRNFEADKIDKMSQERIYKNRYTLID